MSSNRHLADASRRDGVKHVAVVGLVLAVALGVGALGWQALDGSDPAASADPVDCTVRTLSISVAPELERIVDEAADDIGDANPCLALDVTGETVAELDAAQAEVGEGEHDALPDLWIPESPAWRGVVTRAGKSGRVVSPAVATTPVGLATGRGTPAPASWLDTLASDQLVVRDPSANGGAALALVAPLAETRATGVSAEEFQSRLVPLAQGYGAMVASGTTDQTNPDTIAATSRRLIPLTEHEFLVARLGNASLTWRAPATGSPLLSYPLVQPTAGGLEVGNRGIDVVGAMADLLLEWFAGEEGRDELADAMLRGPDGVPLPDSDLKDGRRLDEPDQDAADAVLRSWRTLTVPSSLLTVIDASGSMDFDAGGSTRMALATDAARTALDAFPGHARIGLWAFSIGQGGPGQDWRELAPLRRLDSPAEGYATHKELLAAQTGVLPRITNGGTGLYDTVLAAYRTAVREYNPNYFNSVVVLSDGANDDPGSISQQELLRRLEALRDESRPVRIIGVGISTDADMDALAKIGTATKGQAYLAENPQDILGVLASALLAR